MKFLSSDQKLFYEKNGYIILDKNFLSKSIIDKLSCEYDNIFQRKKNSNLDATWGGDWKEKGIKTEVKSIHGLQMHSAACSEILFHKDLLDVCEDIMETENILLHHTKAHLKPPGTGSPFPMHQDYHYFPFKNDSMIAIFISIDASDVHNGGLCIYPGSHLLGPQEDAGIAGGHHYLDQEKFPISKATPVALEMGQIIIFSYLLIHGSYENKSDKYRRMHLMQFMSAEDEPLADVHKSHCQGMVLRGSNVKMGANITLRHVSSEEGYDRS